MKELVLPIGNPWFCPAHPVYSQAADLLSSWLSLFPQLMRTGHLFHLNRIQQYFDARENTKMLLWKPQRVQLFPGDDMKPIELQEMVIGSYLRRKRAGSEWNRNHCAGSFCLWKSSSSFHKMRLSMECRKRGTENLGTFYPYLFFCSALGLGSRDWWLCKTGARSALGSGRGTDVSCSPPLHCSSWKPAASQQGNVCWLQGWEGAN